MLHISGSSNLFSDFASRNPMKCTSASCAICNFVEELRNCCVGEVTVSDVLSGKAKVPYATKSSWLQIQKSCPDLSRVHKFLTKGATISKKKKRLTDVKRYINSGVMVLTGQHEGLLVVKQASPFIPDRIKVVIPREVSEGLLTAIHISMEHPSANQLKLIFSRGFFCLDLDLIAKEVTDHCYTCKALQKLPSIYHKQTTSVPGKVIGCKYSTDVVNRFSQVILLIREDITSYTVGAIIKDEKAVTLRDGILLLMSQLRSQHGPQAIIRTDPASSLRSLVNDETLGKFNLQIILGDEKNINKNPIAESSVRELHSQLKRLQPLGGKVHEGMLAHAISNMNSLIRNNNHTATEAWTKRSSFTGEPLDLKDADLIDDKYTQRCSDHDASARYKSRGKSAQSFQAVEVGQLVYLFSDASKLKCREKYLVTTVEEDHVWVQKFTRDQFRKRTYRVKRSDLIVIPKGVSSLPDSCKDVADDPNLTEDDKYLPGDKDRINYPNKKVLPPQASQRLPLFTSESSDEESDDDCDGDDMLHYFLSNQARTPVNLVESDTPDDEEEEELQVPPERVENQHAEDIALGEARPVRVRNRPDRLGYLPNPDIIIEEDEVEENDAAPPGFVARRRPQPAEHEPQEM